MYFSKSSLVRHPCILISISDCTLIITIFATCSTRPPSPDDDETAMFPPPPPVLLSSSIFFYCAFILSSYSFILRALSLASFSSCIKMIRIRVYLPFVVINSKTVLYPQFIDSQGYQLGSRLIYS